MRKFIVVMCSVLCIGVFGRAFALDCDIGYEEGPMPRPGVYADGYQWYDWGGNQGSHGTIQTNPNLPQGWWRAQWSTNLPHGIIEGESSCYSVQGSTDGAYSDTNMSGITTGAYCWCKARTWNGVTLDTPWVYHKLMIEYNDGCKSSGCAYYCAYHMANKDLYPDDGDAKLQYMMNSIRNTACVFDQCPSGYFETISNDTYICTLCDVGYENVPLPRPSVYADGYQYYNWADSKSKSGGTIQTNPNLPKGWWRAQWSTNAPYGILEGESSCYSVQGSTDGAYSDTNMSGISTGAYCWCKARTWNGRELDTPWVYYKLFVEMNSGCKSSGCAYYCGYYMGHDDLYPDDGDAKLQYMMDSIRDTVCEFDQCPAGYYETSSNGNQACSLCPVASNFYAGSLGTLVPSVDNDSISSAANSQAITACYANGNTPFHDATGVFTFSSNCNYSNQ